MVDLRTILVVGGGAAVGGAARYLVQSIVLARAGPAALPVGTFAINVSGSFLIGLVVGVLASRADLSSLWRPFLATGILGGYTTFSTFSLDALDLARGGLIASAAYVVASVVFGIAAAYAGLAVARAL